jgi:hypothetical protein
MTRMADEYERADHERDLRKHDKLPPLPLHVQTAPSMCTALDVAVCVKALKNVLDAAHLIEQYADAKAAAIRLDAVAAGARP